MFPISQNPDKQSLRFHDKFDFDAPKITYATLRYFNTLLIALIMKIAYTAISKDNVICLSMIGNPRYTNKKRPPTMGTQMKVTILAVPFLLFSFLS